MNTDGVIFDLDGTLTRPYFDFDRIRAEIGLPDTERTPILEAVAKMSGAERERANAILERHEYEAAHACELYDDAVEVVERIRGKSVPVAILTRNSRSCTQIVMQRHGLCVDWVHTREDGPVKPAPDAILRMCERWRATPGRVWMVGDYLFDLLAGKAAGTRTALMIGDDAVPEYAHEADHVIRRLTELLRLLRE